MILNLSSKSVIFLLSLSVLGVTGSFDLAYGETMVLDASAGKTIRDSSGSNTCSNRSLTDQSTADWINGRLYSTGTANRDCERQTGQWSLIDIPDNAIITDVDYSYTISSVTNGRACNVYPLTYDVSTATLSQLFSDARDGPPYISNNSDCLTTGSKSYDLGVDADSDLQSALTTTDRFGLGFTYFDEALTSVSRTTITSGSGTLVVTYTLPLPTITINDISITEGNSGTTSATFTISRSNNLAPISVQYKTTDGTATSSDYTAVSLTTLNFAAGGPLSQTVSISVNGDTMIESDESFYLDLSNCIGCVIADSQGIATITSEELPPTITINDISITEGNSGTQNLVFTITRNNNLAPISVQYKTTDGTAISGDYTAVSLTTLNFAAGGPLTNTVTISVNGDTASETDETFYLDLSNCIGCVIADSQGMGTITSDDPLPTITINDISIIEGDSGTKSATFTVSRSDNLAPISVQYKTTDGTATSGDYTAVPLSTLTFAVGGPLTNNVTVSVKGDNTTETDETFYLDLSNCIGCVIADSQGMGTITSDEIPPTITINNITLTEGNFGSKSATFTVTRNTSTSSISVQYKTSDGTANTSDYTTLPLTTLSFPTGGALSKTVTVSVKGETIVETDETFYLDLSNCTGCTITDSQGMATITNNDYLPANVTIDDVALTEGNSGAKNFVFTISRSDNLKDVSLTYQTNDGTASYSFSDYDSLSRNTLRLSEGGPLTGTITVAVNGNSVLEPNETFFVDLSNCNDCELIDSQGVGTILNDDEFIAPPQNSTRPVLIMMARGDITNHQEVMNVFKKYAAPSDLKFTSAGAPPNYIYDQLVVNNIAFGLSLEKVYQQSQVRQGESTYLGYDPEWFEGGGGSTPEAEYKDYVNSVITASHYAHDNGFKFVLTPLLVDIENHATEFAPYVDVVSMQIPHFTRNFATKVLTGVQEIKSANPDAIVLVQLIPTNDTSSKLNNDVEVIIDAYNSIRDHVDGVLVYYYDAPNPAPVLDRFYQGIGMIPNQ